MPVTSADIVASVRAKANIERSRFISDEQIVGWVNDEIADLWDTICNLQEGYFAKIATFNLTGRSSISVAEACGGTDASSIGPGVCNPGGTVDHTNTDPQIFTPLVPLAFPDGIETAVLFSFQFFPDGGTAGSDTAVTLYLNGQPTAMTGVVKAGDAFTGFQLPTITVDMARGDVMTIVAQPSSTAGSNWAWEGFVYAAFGDVQTFMKETSLSYQRNGKSVEINRLRKKSDRGRVHDVHYELIGDELYFYYPPGCAPVDPITIEYIPLPPTLLLGPSFTVAVGETNINDVYAQVLAMKLPATLERFRSFIENGACAEVKVKRSMLDEAAQFRAKQEAQRKNIIQSASNRTHGPRFVPAPQHSEIRWSPWRNRY